MTHRIVTGGTGFIGQHLIKQWLNAGLQVTVIGRSVKKIASIYGDSVQAISWDELPSVAQELFKGVELVLNLTGANIGEKRWTNQRKQEILASRVDYTSQLCELLALLGDKAPPLYNASAIGIYGLAKQTTDDELSSAVDEDTVIDFESYPDFLATVARQWENASHACKAHGVYVLHLRFAVVLGQGGGVLSKLLPSFQLGLGGKIGTGKQAFSWVHIDDLGRIIEYLLQHPELHGAVNIVAPECVSQQNFAKTLAKVLHRPAFLTTPAWLLHQIFGEMAQELLLSGQHVKPKRLTDMGYTFLYPTLEQALMQCTRKKTK